MGPNPFIKTFMAVVFTQLSAAVTLVLSNAPFGCVCFQTPVKQLVWGCPRQWSAFPAQPWWEVTSAAVTLVDRALWSPSDTAACTFVRRGRWWHFPLAHWAVSCGGQEARILLAPQWLVTFGGGMSDCDGNCFSCIQSKNNCDLFFPMALCWERTCCCSCSGLTTITKLLLAKGAIQNQIFELFEELSIVFTLRIWLKISLFGLFVSTSKATCYQCLQNVNLLFFFFFLSFLLHICCSQ